MLTLTGMARTARTRPHISRSHSWRRPSRVRVNTSILLVLATTRWPNSVSGVSAHLTELDTEDGGWKVVMSFMSLKLTVRQGEHAGR